ncbi:response regulator [Dongia sedimenti]|uniref:Response regulator n=1 Tax=Dongia sedimenti TaxID=3064282 RepID=A0ABU0YLX1_9PROT|nr:response regulator [Rhodospirillaceae bacterium R-7]
MSLLMPQGTRLGAPAGTDFSPAVYPHRPQRFAREDSRGADGSTQAPGPVLVVEDDFLVAMQIEATLAEAGFAVAGVAASGEEAIDLAGSVRPALALMDIRLAGTMDGVDAALVLFRKLGIRCIFATAHNDPEVRRRATPAEPLGWLRKPYTMPALLEAVRQALSDLEADSE